MLTQQPKESPVATARPAIITTGATALSPTMEKCAPSVATRATTPRSAERKHRTLWTHLPLVAGRKP